MPVGYEYGGPFLGQGEIGFGAMMPLQLDKALRKVRKLTEGLELHPEFYVATRQLTEMCLDEAQLLGPNVPEVREGLVLECSDYFDKIFQAHLTVDIATKVDKPWFSLDLPSPKLLLLLGYVAIESYQYIMNDEGHRNRLRQTLKDSFERLLDEVNWRILIIELNNAGLGATNVVRTTTAIQAGIGFRRWLDNVHLHSYDVFKEILRDPNERLRADYKKPGIVERAYAQQAQVDKEWSFERFHTPPVRRPWNPWVKKRRKGYAI